MSPEAVRKTARGMAVAILNRVALTRAFAEPLLDVSLSRQDLTNIHDRRLLTELVYGVLRMQGHLDWVVAKFYRGDFPALNIYVKNILRTGLYQLLYTSRIPASAVVDEAVKLAKVHHPSGAGLVNAILRNFLRGREGLVYPRLEEEPLEHIAVVHSHPRWLVKRWLDLYGREETAALCAANNEVPPTTLRVNRLKMTRKEAACELREEGMEVKETLFSPDGLIVAKHGPTLRETVSYQKGQVLMQDEASQLIAHLLAPRPDECILDFCAGNGLKTTHLAEIMDNRGDILALDIKAGKTASLLELAGRLGIGIVETKLGDAAADMGRAWYDYFDRVLVDAPCSGLGTVRRNPEIKWRLRPGDINSCAALQKKILHNAAICLKRGGTLVYSVCTVTPEENEAVIDDFLSRHREFCLTPARELADLDLCDQRGFVRTSPVRHGMDGFFGAVLTKCLI